MGWDGCHQNSLVTKQNGGPVARPKNSLRPYRRRLGERARLNPGAMLIPSLDGKRAMVRYDAPPLHVNASLSRGDIRGVAAAISADRARCEIRRRRLRSFQLIRRKWRMGTALSEPGDTSRELLGRSGVAANALDGCIDGPEKLLAQSDAAALIPDIRIGEVEFGFWRNDQFSGHTGRALVALCLATIVPKPGPGKDGLSGAPVLVLATRGRVLPRGWPRGRPRDLPLAGAFLPGSDQKSKFQYRSLHPPSVHSLRYGAPP